MRFRRPGVVLLLGLIAGAVLAALPSPGQAAITIGPDTSVDTLSGTSCSPIDASATCSNATLPGDVLVASPIDGVVVRWRARTNLGNVLTAAFRVLRSTSPGYTTGAGTTEQQTFQDEGSFPTRLPIQNGDRIGLDVEPSSMTCSFNCLASINGGTHDQWKPPLVDDEMPGHTVFFTYPSNAVLLNADIEPDADGDAFGDETQDKCPGLAGNVDGCAPSGQSSVAPPHASLGGSKSQDVLGQGAVIVVVSSDQVGNAAAAGTISAPGASKVFALKPASADLTAGAKTRLKLKLSRKAKKGVRKSLKRGKRPKASVSVTVKNSAGGVTVVKQTVKVKKKRSAR